jgi:cytochrome P450
MRKLKQTLNNILNYDDQSKKIDFIISEQLITANKDLVKKVYTSRDYEVHNLTKKIAKKFASSHRLSLDGEESLQRKKITKEFYYKNDYSDLGKKYCEYALQKLNHKNKENLYEVIDDTIYENFICDFLGIENEKKFFLNLKKNKLDMLGKDESFLKICALTLLPLPKFFYKKIIPSFYTRYETINEMSEHIFLNCKAKKNSLLEFLLESYDNKYLTKEEVIGEIKTVVIGTHTLSSSISMCLSLLAKKQEEQEKISKSDVYSKWAYLECLRLNGPTYLLPYTEKSKCPISKTKSICVSVTHLHKNKKYWKNAESFDPSRFEQKIDPYTFIPFGSGKTGCPGKNMSIDICSNFLHHFFKNVRITLLKEPSYNRTMFRDINNHELICGVIFLNKQGF